MVGWKDILRPIRDGFRDQLPSRPPKEDDEESQKRRRQRGFDSLKGFAYFDTFEEIERWSSRSVDPLQCSNTPLLVRPSVELDEPLPKANITLIHDYSGNYHEYEACQGSPVAREKYSCKYMQYIDTFVYFSHKLVCVPPPTWTNSLHRNGVRALGTFLVEPQSIGISNILERTPSSQYQSGWEYKLATKLTLMAKTYGFEGWLLNIEKTFPYSVWDVDMMAGFISQLSSHLGHGNVIWYDALTTSNILKYQNGLTQKNLVFAKAAGTILTNYDWTYEKLIESKKLALTSGVNPQDVAFGIDVWAQNTHPKQIPRHTYGGGGTNTGVAVAELSKAGLSAGIFAPAWPFEHFPDCSLAVQCAMWEGDKLPDDLRCDCEPRELHHDGKYRNHAITRFAHESPAGSDSFFHTNFARAFGEEPDSGRIFVDMGAMSILPRLSNASPRDDNGEEEQVAETLTGILLSNPARVSLALRSKRASDINAKAYTSLTLYRLSMTGFLVASITYRKPRTPPQMHISIDLVGSGHSIPLPIEACSSNTVEAHINCTKDSKTGTCGSLTAIAVVIDTEFSPFPISETAPVLEILEITIKPQNSKPRNCNIASPVLSCHHNDLEQIRLSWTCQHDLNDGSGTDDRLPYSSVTGPVSQFIIYVDEKAVGRAYGLCFLVDDALAENLGWKAAGPDHKIAADSEIKIEGVGFDGTVLGSCVFSARAIQLEPKGREMEQQPMEREENE